MFPEPHFRKQSQWAVGRSQEKRPRCDEQPKAHAPEMPRDALCSKNTAAHQHADVPRGGTELEDGVAVGRKLVKGSICLLAAAGDVRMLVGGGVLGAKRIARHLCRMCFGLFI